MLHRTMGLVIQIEVLLVIQMGVLLVIKMGVLLVNMYLQSLDMKMDIELQGLFHPVIILMIIMNISLWEITMEGIPLIALVRIELI